MLGIVITGHGKFATGLLSAVEQVIGSQTQCKAIDFPEGVSTEELASQLEDACNACDNGDGIVLLCDLLGGSPFRQASQIALTKNNYEVISGTNMQIAAEMLLEREELTAAEFRNAAVICGKDGITSLWHELSTEDNNTDF